MHAVRRVNLHSFVRGVWKMVSGAELSELFSRVEKLEKDLAAEREVQFIVFVVSEVDSRSLVCSIAICASVRLPLSKRNF